MRKRNLMAAFAALGALSIQTGFAADAAHPYSNVNHAVDAGNNTGDNQVDQLNQQQLSRAQNNRQGYATNGSYGSGYAYGNRSGYYAPRPAYPYAAYPYPPPYYAPAYYAPAYYRPVFGWGWRPGWGWRHRYWGPRVGVGIVLP